MPPEKPGAPNRLGRFVHKASANSWALLSEGAGLAPDIVYARGVPNLTPPPLHSYTPRQCSLLLVEVGFCQDLRLQTKEQLKLGKYEALVQALQRRWGRVKLIGIPIGIGGTVSGET